MPLTCFLQQSTPCSHRTGTFNKRQSMCRVEAALQLRPPSPGAQASTESHSALEVQNESAQPTAGEDAQVCTVTLRYTCPGASEASVTTATATMQPTSAGSGATLAITAMHEASPLVDEKLVRSIADCACDLPLELRWTWQSTVAVQAAEAAAAEALAAAQAKPAGSNKGAAKPAMPPKPPTPGSAAQPSAESATLVVNLSDLLVGDTSTECSVPLAALDSLPSSLASATLRVSCLMHNGDSRPASRESGTSMAAASASTPLQTPMQLLPPQVRQRLAPLIVRITEAADMPDAPATTAELLAFGEPCQLRHRLPTQPGWRQVPAVSGERAWRPGPAPADPADPPLQLRNLHFGGTSVLFVGDMDAAQFVHACTEGALEVEVRDRDAAPARLPLALPAALPPAAVPDAQPDSKGKLAAKAAVRVAMHSSQSAMLLAACHA